LFQIMRSRMSTGVSSIVVAIFVLPNG